MSTLRQSMAEYLAVRRALGYKLEQTERFLGQFLDYLDAIGVDRITVEHALTWATLPGRGQHWHAMRLGAVRGFARYVHEVDPRVEVPTADLLPRQVRPSGPLPLHRCADPGVDRGGEHAARRAQDRDVSDAVRSVGRDGDADRGSPRAGPR